MAYYWVNQGKTFSEEFQQGILWAPTKSKIGNSLAHWDLLTKVQPGDIIFSYARQYLCAISVCEQGAVVTDHKPVSSSAWGREGYQVRTKYQLLPKKIPKAYLVWAGLKKYCPDLFDGKDYIQLKYLMPLDDATGKFLIKLSGLDEPEYEHVFVDAVVASIPDQTEREAVRKSRIGQGKFRDDLINYWKGQCPVTGITSPELLRASHIKRWSDSNNQERLDVFNGILLAAHIDAAFDAGLISFSDDGKLLVGQNLQPGDVQRMGLQGLPAITLHARHRQYLKAHRTKFGF